MNSSSEPSPGQPLLLVVPHVHWDREWYRPFAAFQPRLVALVEQVLDELDDGRMPAFHLDGQTITIADVLAVRPDLEPRLRAHLATGRLTVGPWHVLADNQLVSAENLVRNLLTGRRWMARLGTTAPVGYSPDAFGHPADLPRVLVGFGLDTALVWRGAPAQLPYFRWSAPDGSEILTINQRYYNVDVLWAAQGRQQRLTAWLAAERGRNPDGPWLLPDGADHVYPADARARVAGLEAPGATVRLGGLAQYRRALHEALAATSGSTPQVVGPLRRRGDELTFVLTGTLSTRTWLKQLHARTEVRLERWVEPLLATDCRPAELALLRRAWDDVLANSAHDSICGCSVDQVHRDNRQRAEAVLQAAATVEARVLRRRGLDTRPYGPPPADEVWVVVGNPHGQPTTGPVTVEVNTHPARGVSGLVDAAGLPLPVEAVDLGVGNQFEADLDLLPADWAVRRHRVSFVAADVPAFGFTAYRVLLGEPGEHAPVVADDATLAVDGWVATADGDGSVTLTDTHTGRPWRGVGRLEDVGDRGDSYTFDPVDDAPVGATLQTAQVERSAVRDSLLLTLAMAVPVSLDAGRERRAAARTTLPVQVRVTRWAGLPGWQWQVRGENTAADHRLRLHVPAPGATTWTATTHWSSWQHPLRLDVAELPERPLLEAVNAAQPTHDLAVTDGPQAVAVLPRGIVEVAGLLGVDGADPALAVTLLRAVGWLSRPDLRTRTAAAGPHVATPQAQVPGPFEADLWVLAGRDVDPDPLSLASSAQQHRAPLRAWVARPGSTPTLGRDGAVAGPSVDGALVSAWKPADDADGAVLRVWNPTPAPRAATIRLPAEMVLMDCRFDETPLDGAVAAAGPLTPTLGPFEVRTYRVRDA
jgi:alpha-mannosidase/mannosylglycerate hydrolase